MEHDFAFIWNKGKYICGYIQDDLQGTAVKNNPAKERHCRNPGGTDNALFVI